MPRLLSQKERDKLVKVLNLATSANENEADAAFAKAEEFLLTKGLSLARARLKNNYLTLSDEVQHWLQIVTSCVEEVFYVQFIFEVVNFDWLVVGHNSRLDAAFWALQSLYDKAAQALQLEEKNFPTKPTRFSLDFLEGFAIGVDFYLTSSRNAPKWQDRLPRLSEDLTEAANKKQQPSSEQIETSAAEIKQSLEIYPIGMRHGHQAAMDILGRTMLGQHWDLILKK